MDNARPGRKAGRGEGDEDGTARQPGRVSKFSNHMSVTGSPRAISSLICPPGRSIQQHVRDVFGQYYLWRNQFHRWFGLCVAKSARVRRLAERAARSRRTHHLPEQEIKGDHHGLAVSFLAALGIDDPSRIAALPVTDAYAESFLRCYFSGEPHRRRGTGRPGRTGTRRARPQRDHHQRASQALRRNFRPGVLRPAHGPSRWSISGLCGRQLPTTQGGRRTAHRSRQAGDLGARYVLGRRLFRASWERQMLASRNHRADIARETASDPGRRGSRLPGRLK